MQVNQRVSTPTSRRRALGVVGWATAAFSGLMFAGQRAAHAQDADGTEPLVGSWMVAATPSGAAQAPPRVLVSFSSDGVALRSAPVQQAAPPALGAERMVISTTHGAWQRNPDGTYVLTFLGLAFDETGKFLATQRIRVAVAVSEMAETFSGPYQTDFESTPNQVIASATGMVQATRIQPEPLG